MAKSVFAVIGITLLVCAGVAGFAYYLNQQQIKKVKELEMKMKVVQDTVATVAQEKQQQEAAEMAKKKLEAEEAAKRVAVIKARANALRDVLSPEAVKSLEVVLVYVDENPQAVFVQKTEYPKDVQDAIEVLKQSIRREVAGGAFENKLAFLAEKVAALQAQGESTAGVQLEVGDEITLTGEFGYDTETPIGEAFTLQTARGNVFYFLFSEPNAEKYKADYVGEQVAITVEITDVQPTYVLYDVVKGPVLVQPTPGE